MHPSSPTGEPSFENGANCVSEVSAVKVKGEASKDDVPGSPSCPVSSSTSTCSTPTPTPTPGRASLLSPSSCESRIPRLSGSLGSSGSPVSPDTTTTSRGGLRRSSSLRLRGEERTSLVYQSPVASVSSTLTPRQHHRRPCHPLLYLHQPYHCEPRTLPVITDNECDSPRQRSLSLSLTPVRPRVGHAAPGGSSIVLDDSDAESVRSYGSACSTASACDHATIALNGTTWSGRSRKYVVHCSNHTGDNEQYLTPTQRAARQVRKFQALLKEARKEIEEKDREIARLTKEVVELRLYKASLNSPDERTDSSDCLTVRENNPFSPESPTKDLLDESVLQKASEEEGTSSEAVTSPDTPEKRVQPDLPSSLADSGHFEDGSVHSKDSIHLLEAHPDPTKVTESTSSQVQTDSSDGSFSRLASVSPDRDAERRALVDLYENRIENMHRRHVDEIQELKQKHNDKVESLLNQLSEVNTRYCEVRPSLDAAEVRTRELESELETVKQELAEQKTLFNDQEERHKQMYLKMYAKGQEAARIEQADKILENAHKNPPKVTVAELLQQLTVAQAELENMKDTSYSPEPHISADRSQSLLSAQEAVSLWVLGTRKAMYRRVIEVKSQQGALDPEITLQFLKSAIYYFLTDKENYQGHLNAIESILGFTEAEKHNIDKIHRQTKK